MGRVSGQPEQKQRYLEQLDEKQFPFLIADILFFVYNHKDIKILDGPGDGKRDIFSNNNAGKAFITQCKFHKDFSKSVSSRETDEIAIALVKFKTSYGIFATTGRLSPQAKREFLDNFPSYELSFLEGFEIVDIVLSNPILTSVWVNNESIELSSKTLAVPFIMRDTKEDKSMAELPKTEGAKELTIERDTISKDYFYPYRSPSIATFKEYGTFLNCCSTIYNGPVQLHKLNELIESCLSKITQLLHSQSIEVSLRIGNPYLVQKVDNEFKNRVKLEVPPRSYIFVNGKRFSEQEFIIPCNDSRFIFPNRFGHLESPWAAWFYPKACKSSA